MFSTKQFGIIIFLLVFSVITSVEFDAYYSNPILALFNLIIVEIVDFPMNCNVYRIHRPYTWVVHGRGLYKMLMLGCEQILDSSQKH